MLASDEKVGLCSSPSRSVTSACLQHLCHHCISTRLIHFEGRHHSGIDLDVVEISDRAPCRDKGGVLDLKAEAILPQIAAMSGIETNPIAPEFTRNLPAYFFAPDPVEPLGNPPTSTIIGQNAIVLKKYIRR